MPRNANQSKSSNYSMVFDGTSGAYITAGNNNSLSGPFSGYTISAWVKTPTSFNNNYNAVFTKKYSFYFGFHQDNSFINYGSSGTAYGTEYKSTYTFSLDTWYHLTATADGTNIKMYVNGVLNDTFSDTNTAQNSNTSNTPYLGGFDNSGDYDTYKGKLDSICVFDYALSQDQVTTLWGGGTSVSNPMALPSPPIAYYPLGTSAWNGQYLAENNAIGDYVFDFDNELTSSNNFIDINSLNSNILNSSFSIGIWIKKEEKPSFTDNDRIIDLTVDSNTSFQIICDDSSGKFAVNFILSGVSKINQQAFNSFTASANVWNQIVLTWDGSSYIYYFNGQPVSSTGTIGIGVAGNGFFLGKRADANNTTFYNGKMSNVQIFDTALSSTEVETLYNYGSPIRTLANIPQSSNLKAWYKLDASEVYNSSTTEWSIDNNQNPSAYASSLDFNGSSNYIQIPNLSTINTSGNVSISFWMKTSNTTTAQSIVRLQGDTIGFYMYSDGLVRMYGSSTGRLNSSIASNDGEWHLVVGVYGTSAQKLYIDNVVTASDVGFQGSIGTTGGAIGSRYFSSANTVFQGQISNCSVWNTSLTSAQVTELYNNGTPSNLSSHSATSNLISWWKLNNTTTGIEDAKGSNNGTNNGATEYPGFVNTLAGDSSGMSQANLVQSDLQTVAPYSKYAINFDAADSDYIDCGNNSNLYPQTGDMSYSFWVNPDVLSGLQTIYGRTGMSTGSKGVNINLSNSEVRVFMGVGVSGQWGVNTGGGTGGGALITSNSGLTVGQWSHVALTLDRDGDGVIYINGVPVVTAAMNPNDYSSVDIVDSSSNLIGNGNAYSNVKISNMSVWNNALTSSQVTEIYNEGVPSNLNNHSAYSNLVSWWQLGENSSFDGNDWIVADEKGTNNGTSANMTVANLTNGVGTTANGVSSGMSEGNLVGDAPYSTANAISTNMVVTSRLKEAPPSFDTSSFLYDGIDEYFSGSSVYSSLDGLSNYAVSCWFRSPNYSQTNQILHTSSTAGSIPNQVKVYTRSDRRVFIDHGSNGNYQSYSDNTTLVNNQWYHILCTRDASRGVGDKMRIYINGVDKTANDNTRYAGSLITANQPLFIAKASNSNSSEMEGEIDEIAIYNQDMASYVSEIYAGGKVVNLNNLATAPNPISYFRSEKATWDGSDWSMKDVNSTYTVTSSNMEQADKTTNVP